MDNSICEQYFWKELNIGKFSWMNFLWGHFVRSIFTFKRVHPKDARLKALKIVVTLRVDILETKSIQIGLPKRK